VDVYQRLIDEKQIGRGDFLPPVLPIVLYNGKQAWSAPLDVVDLMGACPDELKAYRPSMRYFLLEEHAREDAELAGMENLAALVFRFEKCRTRHDFEQLVDALGHWAGAPEHGESIKRVVRWIDGILWQDRVPGESVMDLDDIRACGAMLKEQVREWEKAAIEKGIEKGEAEILVRQLE